MRSTLFAGLVSLVLLSGVASAGQGIFPFAYHSEKLPNGLKVLVVPMPSHGLVTYFSIVRTGSRDEIEPGKSGFAHFFEHMMFQGTKQYPRAAYQNVVAGMGAQANAFTTDDLTAFHLTFTREDLEKVVAIESDRFQHLSYDKIAFQTEAGAVYGEYRKVITNPFALLEEKVKDAAFDLHPYKHTTIGFEADIRAMPEAYDYSLDFHPRHYRPENVVLLLVGDVQVQPTVDLIRRYYSDWKPGYVAPAIPAEPVQKAERHAAATYPGATLPILDLAYKGERFDPANRDYVAATLLGELAFGSTSTAYKQLVLRQQKVEELGCEIPMNRDPSLFEILAMVKDPAELPAVQQALERTLEDFQSKPVEAKALADVKRHNKYAFLMNMDSTSKVAGQLVRIIALSDGIEAVNQFYAAVDRVTPEDIQHAARKYFDPARRTVVVLKGARS